MYDPLSATTHRAGEFARRPHGPFLPVSSAEQWHSRAWSANSAFAPGQSSFQRDDYWGTLLVTRGALAGTYRLDIQVGEAGGDYIELSADVRAGWMRDIAATTNAGESSPEAVVDRLLEIARLPNRRTVRMRRTHRAA